MIQVVARQQLDGMTFLELGHADTACVSTARRRFSSVLEQRRRQRRDDIRWQPFGDGPDRVTESLQVLRYRITHSRRISSEKSGWLHLVLQVLWIYRVYVLLEAPQLFL